MTHFRKEFPTASSVRSLGSVAVRGAVACALSITFVGVALADNDDTVDFFASHTFRFDNNLFRLPDGVNPNIAGKTSRDEWFQVSSLGFNIHKPYSLQRFELRASLNSYRYDTYTFLNFESVNYRAAWLWQLTPEFTGTLSSERNRTPAGFADYRSFANRNVITNEVQNLDARWRVFGGVFLSGALTKSVSSNSQGFVEQPSYSSDAVRIGAGYLFPSGSTIEVGQSVNSANLPGTTLNALTQTDNKYEARETELKLLWNLSGRSSLNGRLRHVSRTYSTFASRDYARNVGSLVWSWAISGKLNLDVGYLQDVDAWTARNASYRVSKRVYVAPVWSVGAKTYLSAQLSKSTGDFLGPIAPVAMRNDKYQSLAGTVEWRPLRSLSISAIIQKDQRDSNTLGQQFKANSAGITARVQF